MAGLSEKEIVEMTQELQTVIQSKIKAGDRSVVLQSLNIHLKRGLTVVGNVNSDHRQEASKRNWVKSSAQQPVKDLKEKPAKVITDDNKFIEELKLKTPDQLSKMNLTSQKTIIKTINDKEESEENKLSYADGATRADLGKLIFDYLHPDDKEESEEEEANTSEKEPVTE